MVRILGHVAACHEEHPPRLMRDEFSGPGRCVGTDQRFRVVLTDGIQQSKFSGLLIDPLPQGSVN
jgi:hypothetical protein